METRSLSDIAQESIVYANGKIEASTTSLEFNEQTKKQQELLESELQSTRMRGRSSQNQINIQSNFDRLDMDETIFQFYHAIEGAVESKRGNCEELTAFALEYVADHYPNVRAEMFCIEGGDHVILILGRKDASTEDDPLTWGEAIICDPLYKMYYPANEYLTKLKNFKYETTEEKIINKLEAFDKLKHHLSKIAGYDSTMINSFNSSSSIEEIKKYFKVKLAYIEQLLHILLKEINNPEYEKSNSFKEKIKEINILLDTIKTPEELTNKIIKNKINPTYKEIRYLFKNELKTIINEFMFILEPVQNKAMGIDLFSKEENLEFLKKFDAVSKSLKNIFDDIIANDRDMVSVIRMQENPSLTLEDDVKRGIQLSGWHPNYNLK